MNKNIPMTREAIEAVFLSVGIGVSNVAYRGGDFEITTLTPKVAIEQGMTELGIEDYDLYVMDSTSRIYIWTVYVQEVLNEEGA